MKTTTTYTIKLIIATTEKLLMEFTGESSESFREVLDKCFSSTFFSKFNKLDDSVVIRVWIQQETIDNTGVVVGRCRFLVDTANKTYKPEN